MCESKRSSELVIVKRLGKVISLESRITALWLNTSANQRCCSFKFPFCPIIAGPLWTDDVIFCSDCNISDLQCRNWYKINLAVRIKSVMFLRCVLMLGKERKRKSLCKEMKQGNCNHIYKHQYFMLRWRVKYDLGLINLIGRFMHITSELVHFWCAAAWHYFHLILSQ